MKNLFKAQKEITELVKYTGLNKGDLIKLNGKYYYFIRIVHSASNTNLKKIVLRDKLSGLAFSGRIFENYLFELVKTKKDSNIDKLLIISLIGLIAYLVTRLVIVLIDLLNNA